MRIFQKLCLGVFAYLALQACQQRQYPVFSPSAPVSYSPSPTLAPPPVEPLLATRGALLWAQETTDVPVLSVEVSELGHSIPILAPTTPHKVVRTAYASERTQEPPRKQKPEDRPKKDPNKLDRVSLLAAIFGGGGVLLVSLGASLGILFAPIGFIMGLVGLQRVKRGLASRSSLPWAILGIVLGGVITLYFGVLLLALPYLL